ncbi:hypothetical protein GOBAR_DD06257 [Gossypium barbadense]|nr:hypothetical protein GOBAR_DD06257 [Gossypium barbadense]
MKTKEDKWVTTHPPLHDDDATIPGGSLLKKPTPDDTRNGVRLGRQNSLYRSDVQTSRVITGVHDVNDSTRPEENKELDLGHSLPTVYREDVLFAVSRPIEIVERCVGLRAIPPGCCPEGVTNDGNESRVLPQLERIASKISVLRLLDASSLNIIGDLVIYRTDTVMTDQRRLGGDCLGKWSSASVTLHELANPLPSPVSVVQTARPRSPPPLRRKSARQNYPRTYVTPLDPETTSNMSPYGKQYAHMRRVLTKSCRYPPDRLFPPHVVDPRQQVNHFQMLSSGAQQNLLLNSLNFPPITQSFRPFQLMPPRFPHNQPDK